MYNSDVKNCDNEVIFGLYKKLEDVNAGEKEYVLLGEFSSMDDVLNSTAIDGRLFSEVIMDDNTELVGQD